MGNFFKHIFAEQENDSANLNSRQIDLPQFTEIDAETYTFTINIQGGKNYQAIISSQANENVNITVVGKKLLIREKKPRAKKNLIYTKQALINITLPLDCELLQTKIKAYAGDVTLLHLTMQNLDIELLAGSAKLTDLIVHGAAKINLSAGSLKLLNCKMNLKADLAAGSANIKQLQGQSSFILAAGSLTIIENKNDTTGYDLKTSVGLIKYHQENHHHHFYRKSSGPNSLVAKALAGSIIVK